MNQKRVTGSKGGESKPYTPIEMADNLISINKIKILLAVSDGEVDSEFRRGMVMFNDVSLDSYPDVVAEFRPGTQTQGYIKGFADTSSEITVNRALTTTNPFVYSITNKVISATRVKIMAPRLVQAKSNGDRVGVRVNYKIEIAVDGAPYQTVIDDVIQGKNTTTGYDRTRRVNLPAFNNQVLVRVSRITADSTDSNLVDAIQVQSYAEVVDAKFRYPLTGLIYVEFDSKMFPSGIPVISTKKKWKVVNVPSNYDPLSRTYSGSWDGTFKRAWTNNPAWVLYDLIINQRYGLDQRELGIPVDKWSLYEVAQYCDQRVPDGKGGDEPRYFCDMVVQSQVEAYTLIRDVCSIFRGMSFWNGESLSIIIDKPREPSYIFNNSNVVNGDFSYVMASEKSMYTSCNVTFDDEQNMYQQDLEPVFDYEAALRFGSNPTSFTAIGCVRRSEANRRGRWVLKTNLRSTVINFATGLEGMIPMVGDVIAVADNFWQSNLDLNLSGRIVEVSGFQVFLPFKVDARPGDFIMVNRPDGSPVKRTISSISGDGKTLTLNVGFGFVPQPDTAFLIERTDIAPALYVVSSVKKGDGDEEFTFSISGVQYDPNKYDEVDFGVSIEDRPTSILTPDVLPVPTGINISSYSRIVQGMSVETMVVSWDKMQYATFYEMQWRKDDGNWNNTPQTVANEIDVEGIYTGNYFVRVRTIGATGTSSGWSPIVSAALTGKVGEPGAPINLIATTDEVFGIRVKWGFAPGSGDTAYTELQQSPDGQVEGATLLSMVPYPQYDYWHSILPAGYVDWYRVRTVDRIGNVSPWTEFVRGMATDDFDKIAEVVKIDIENSEGFKDLVENAASTAVKVKEQAQTDIQNALAQDYNMKWTRVENGKRKAEYGTALELIANETEARVTQVEELRVEIDENINAKITNLQEVVATESETRARQVSELTAQMEDSNASIGVLREAIATETEARVQSVELLDAKVADNEASITTTRQALATETEARTTAIQALSTRVGNTEAAVVNKVDSWINASGIGASATVKLGLKYNGVEYAAGYNLQLTQINGVTLAQTVWDVDRFAVGRISGGTIASLPFFIENNQVFMQSAIIKDGTISNAKIGNYIQSNNFVANTQGWQLDKNGNFQNNGSVAGQGRMTMTNNQISVYDGNGVLRVRMGQL
ncbi:tail fiber protein [Erwinia phage Snitter]|nr:tail fiber protein [Erwinia phage Snitter]